MVSHIVAASGIFQIDGDEKGEKKSHEIDFLYRIASGRVIDNLNALDHTYKIQSSLAVSLPYENI